MLNLPHMPIWPGVLAVVVSVALVPYWWKRVRFSEVPGPHGAVAHPSEEVSTANRAR
jgi:hypothetical protein